MSDLVKSFELSSFLGLFPDSVVPILATLALSFLIGLEREERSGGRTYNFGGVRTFPIIGLCGYMMARLSEGHAGFLTAGVLVFGAFFWLSYRKKLEQGAAAGLTSEASGVFTFLLGALLYQRSVWEATALSVIVLLLLELKLGLENMAKKLPPQEIFTFTRFLLIAAVILPIVPNQDFSELHFNPFHTWLVVVVISGLSYGAYLVERLVGARGSILVTALLGGIYSSTSTTVVLAKKSAGDPGGKEYSGAILLASGIMYFRLLALLAIFSGELFGALVIPFATLGILAALAGFFWIAMVGTGAPRKASDIGTRNPLELKSALLFAFLFTAMGVLTALTLQYLGKSGMMGLSFITGLTDVDPFVMSLTQSAGAGIDVSLAAKGIVIATASNNLMKGAYAAMAGSAIVRKQGALSLALLGAVSLLAFLAL